MGKRFAYVAKAVPPVEPPGPEPPPEPPGGGGGGYTDTAYVARCYHTSSYTISVETDDPVIVVAGTPSNYEVSGSSTSHSINVSSGYNGVWLCVTSGSISIESLAITGSRVREIGNIDDVSGLKTLDVSDNDGLVTLDVSGSDLTTAPDITDSKASIESMDFSNCDDLVGLYYDYLSGCDALTTLVARDCASLRFVNGLSRLPAIVTIDLSGSTQVTSSIVLNDPDEGNLLKTLDVSNTAIDRLMMDYADSLTTLNVEGCDDLYLIRLTAPILTELDLSSLLSSTTFTQLKLDAESLTELDVAGSNLTLIELTNLSDPCTIDITNCLSLTRLELYDMTRTSLAVTGLGSVTYLRLDNCVLDSFDESVFVNVESLYLYNNLKSGATYDFSYRPLTTVRAGSLTGRTECLDTLNLSNCALLTSFRMNDHYQDEAGIVTVNFTGCLSLDSPIFEGYHNVWTKTLNFTNCTALTEILMYSAGIAFSGLSLIFDGCSALTSFSYNFSGLKSVSFSGSPNLASVELRNSENCTSITLGTGLGSLASFTIDDAHALTSITFATGLSSLAIVAIGDAYVLASLDLSNLFSVLERLTVSGKRYDPALDLDVSGATALYKLTASYVNSLRVVGCTALDDVLFSSVPLPASVDETSQVVVDLDNNGLSNGDLDIYNGPGSLNAAGEAARTSLQGKGWDVDFWNY